MDVDGEAAKFIKETEEADKSPVVVEKEKPLVSENVQSSKVDVTKPYRISVDISNNLPKGISAEEIIRQVCGPMKNPLPKITPIIDMPPPNTTQTVDVFIKPAVPLKTYGFKRSKGQQAMRRHNFKRRSNVRLQTHHYQGLAEAIFKVAQQEQVQATRGVHRFARFQRPPLGPNRPTYVRGPRAVETPPPPPPQPEEQREDESQ